ncbi:hypothetical protein EVAR_18776_1 [Eumeta japonica]|uniref:Integrase catalytic domain-containing protein n=1 Tax=Eumeta variegata TaxID=151549 RepID=A0A4C1ULK5_EUMVA|nr:hypothetical protein EVAR_18776_1 [Eumeta japonica]
MFLQMKIRKEDRDNLRFLWQNKVNENPQEYRMTSLIFGAALSLCTEIYLKNRNASEFKLEYRETYKAIRLDHYVDDFLKSFDSIEEGVDYFEPMIMTISHRYEKRYGSLFTCLTTRAVHIELAESLSSDSIILALRRFIARRGTSRVIYSDNGTNFVSANKELMNIREIHENVKKEADIRTIYWKFVPPGIPNMDGAWKRLVRSEKNHVGHYVDRKRSPHEEEEVLHSLMLEAEHTVNSRPLTEVDIEPRPRVSRVTPFLIGRSCGVAATGHFDDNKTYPGPNTKSVWWTSRRLAAFCGVPLRKSSYWCHQKWRLLRVLSSSTPTATYEDRALKKNLIIETLSIILPTHCQKSVLRSDCTRNPRASLRDEVLTFDSFQLLRTRADAVKPKGGANISTLRTSRRRVYLRPRSHYEAVCISNDYLVCIRKVPREKCCRSTAVGGKT